MPDVLVYADSIKSPEMRHEVPLAVPDAFLYAEHDGRRFAVVSSLEADRIREADPEIEVRPLEEFGMDELLVSGMPREQADNEIVLRTCRGLGIASAVVPATFPLELADYLRENGVELRADGELFARRRRVKTEAELEGIRRAQRGAEAGMAAARELLRSAERSNGVLTLDGEPLTCERIKVAVERAFSEHGVAAEEFIVSHGPQTAVGHEMGHGPIAPGEPVVLDLFPRDRESGCYADMTRTFVVGEPTEEIEEYQRLCREALRKAVEAVRPGVRGLELHRLICDFFGGTATRRSSRSSRARSSRTASSTRSGTASGSRCTSSRGSAAHRASSSQATWSRSSRASTAPAGAAAGSRISCS
jgi:Xaa-Pro aminopeptidase